MFIKGELPEKIHGIIMTLLLAVDGKALASYLADIFVKLNVLNKELQGTNMTPVNSKANLFGCISFLNFSKKIFLSKNLNNFIG